MGVFNVFKTAQMIPNRATHHIRLMCSELAIKTPEWHWYGFLATIFIVSFKEYWHVSFFFEDDLKNA